MRLALLSVLALAPSAAFACAMYIPSEELKQAMAEVDQAAKPAQPAVQAPAAVPAAPAEKPAAQAAPAEKPAVQTVPAAPAEKPAMPTSAPPAIAEVSEPAS